MIELLVVVGLVIVWMVVSASFLDYLDSQRSER
jgi:hypothetical protein